MKTNQALVVWTVAIVLVQAGIYQGLALTKTIPYPPIFEGVAGSLLAVVCGFVAPYLMNLAYQVIDRRW